MFLGETKPNAKLSGQEKANIGIAGLFSALLSILPVLGLPIGALLSGFAPIPLLYVGFQHGFRPVLLSGFVAFLGIAASGQIELALNFGICIFAMVALVSFFLFRKQSQTKPKHIRLGQIIFALSLYVSVILVLTQSSMEAQPSFLEKLEEISRNLGISDINQFDRNENRDLFLKMAPYLPAMISATFLFLFVGLMFLTQTLYLRKTKVRPYLVLSNMHLPDACFYMFLISFLGSFLSVKTLSTMSVNAVIVFSIPFLLKGLGGIHGFISRKAANGVQARFLRLAFYFTSFVFSWLLLFATFYGFYLFLEDRNYFRPLKIVKK